jgi:PPK2 family polyphosphate:nucleotide phosphotransferase
MEKIRLQELSTRAPKELEKEKTKTKTVEILKELNALQNLLYAESRHSILVILQGMDASGKDGVIRNVFGSFNPQGVRVSSFKVPTEKELAHDFLWRIHADAPAKGMIQIFNRSHYEDILVTRVHKWCDDETARERMRAINDFEELLQVHNNTRILKFYLHVSQEEQESRLQERINDKTKQWKFNEKDFEEAKLRDEYIKMYDDCFEHCNHIPWTIVPADQNWFKEHLIALTLLETLASLKMQYPAIKKLKDI